MTDVVVLGGGPAGYATALRAATHGMSVTLVEADKVGGTCLHRGCIPSKAMLHVGEILDTAHESWRLGLELVVKEVDPVGISAFRDGVVEQMHGGLASLLKQRGVEVVEGRGTIADDGRTVLVGDQQVAGRHLVIATGSKVRTLRDVPVDGWTVVSSDEITTAHVRTPRRGLVVGGGAVGLELASLWRSLGAEEVTVVEALDRIAPLEDPDLSEQLTKDFERRGITTMTGARVAAVKVDGDVAAVSVQSGDDIRKLEVDRVLVAVGRAPCTDEIGLDALGVLDDQGYVNTDGYGRTAVERVYAAGDLLAPPALALAHAGFAEGFTVADVIAGVGHVVPVDYTQVPRVTYTSPEVASVGLTEPQARERGTVPEVTKYSLRGNAKGVIHGSEGFVKVVAEKGGRVLGIHVIGPHATELISEAHMITAWGALPSEVAQLVHPHPTLSEAIGEAHLAAAGLPFHSH